MTLVMFHFSKFKTYVSKVTTEYVLVCNTNTSHVDTTTNDTTVSQSLQPNYTTHDRIPVFGSARFSVHGDII